MAEPTRVPGRFAWRELMTDDVEAARRFLGEIFHWTWKPFEMGTEGTYWIALLGDEMVCGVMAKPPGPEMPTAWSSYVLVDGVDAAVARAEGALGTVLVAPTDIPDVGRFAAIQDPWGAVLYPFLPISGGDEAPPAGPPAPGHFCWETLTTPDPGGAIDWYAKVIGFGSAPSPTGQGTVFTSGGSPVADVQPAHPGGPSFWATYVAVADAMASRDRAVALGGKVLVPRVDVPRVGIVAVIADPGGGALGIFQPLRQG